MDLNSVVIFTQVVKASSFSKAAQELAVTKSTISKKVSDLEVEIGTTLLRRTTRSLQLTEAGKAFYEQCSKALSEIKEATEVAQAASAEPRGVLRVTAPSDFATSLLSPLLAGFLNKYPQISLEMVLSDKTLDLVRDNIDVAIRLGALPDSSLRAKKLGRDVFQLVASPAYLKKSAVLKDIRDLKNHPCLVFAPKPDMLVWKMKNANARFNLEPTPRFVANNITSVKALVMEGAGIALIPVSNCREEIADKKLKVVLPEWSMEDAPIHCVYQKHLFISPKVRVFVDYLEKELKPFFQW